MKATPNPKLHGKLPSLKHSLLIWTSKCYNPFYGDCKKGPSILAIVYLLPCQEQREKKQKNRVMASFVLKRGYIEDYLGE